MSIETTTKPESIPNHECPYADRVAEYRKHMGYSALHVTYLDNVVASLHIDGECPPTHGNGPTNAWEEILDYTRY